MRKLVIFYSLIAIFFAVFVRTEDVESDKEFPKDNSKSNEDSTEILENAETISDKLTEDQSKEMKESAKTFTFQAEVTRLMDIIINSLYTQKEVFIRELISNAADALEKARFLSITDPGYLGEHTELSILVDTDPEAKTITIQDSGVGMTREDLIQNLGTVARSGTTNFLEAVAESGDVNLIGQFGVGFYSAFLVADRVTVTSKHNSEPDQHIWESMIGGSYSVAKDPRGNTLGRGTRVTLHLKEDSTQFLKDSVIEGNIQKFNQFVTFPIKFRKTYTEMRPTETSVHKKDHDLDEKKKDVDKESEDIDIEKEDIDKEKEDIDKEKEDIDKEKEDIDGEKDVDSEDADIEKKAADKEEENTEPKTTPVVISKWIVLNPKKPLWMRPKENITEEEYHSFYSYLSDEPAPTAYSHFTAEGEVEFTALLFIPATSPHDDYSSYFSAKQSGVRLYSRRILVADSVYELLPKWLGFVRGIVDSDDLPLKVDRESFSQEKITTVIRNKIVGKFIDLVRKLSADDITEWAAYKEKIESNTEETSKIKTPTTKFSKIWKLFGRNIKVGCVEDENRNKIAKILRFPSTKTSPNELISLDQYVERMPESQTHIYFHAADSIETAKTSPHMQYFLKKDYEVLILNEPIDEGCVDRLKEYKKKPILSIEKSEAKASEVDKDYEKKVKKAFAPLTKFMSGQLFQKIKGVDISHTLVEAPAVVSVASLGSSSFADRIARAQLFGTAVHQVSTNWMYRYLDLNPSHPIIKEMLKVYRANPEDPILKKTTELIYDTAMLSSGFTLTDPKQLSDQLYSSISKSLGIADTDVVADFVLTEEELTEGSDDENEIKLDEKPTFDGNVHHVGMEDFKLDDDGNPLNEATKDHLDRIHEHIDSEIKKQTAERRAVKNKPSEVEKDEL